MVSIPKLDKETLNKDATAGLTSCIVKIPDAIGDSILAGVNPAYGLYSLIVGAPVGALLASSEVMVLSTTSAMALTVSAGLVGIGGDTRIEALFVLTFLVGVFQLLAGLLRFGRLTRFVSNAVMVGFFSGVGVLIVLGQLSNFTGYQGSGSNKIAQTFDLLTHLNLVNPATALVGIVTLAIIVGARQTRLRNFAAILAIVVSSVLVQLLGLSSVAPVSSIAAITASLPLPALPNLLLSPMIVTAALSAAVIGLIQGAGISGAYPNSDGTYPDISRDFVGQGVSNLVAGLFRGMPIGASIGQTAVMLAAGAKTRLANVFSAAFLVIILLLFGSWLERVPLAAIAALLIVAGVGTVSPERIREVWRVSLSARATLLLTFGATLVLPIQVAVLVGVVGSIVFHVYKASVDVQLMELVLKDDGSAVEQAPPSRLSDGRVTVLDFYGSAFFASASVLRDRLPDARGAHRAVVVLRLRGRRELGSTFIEVLGRYARALHDGDGKLMLAGVSVLLKEQLMRSKYGAVIGAENVFAERGQLGASTREAVAQANEWLARPG